MTNRSHYFLHSHFGTISSKMCISTSLTTKQTFQATNPNKTNHSPVFQTYSNTVTQYTSFTVKPTKMLSDPVPEAFGPIHRHPSGENLLANRSLCDAAWKISDVKMQQRERERQLRSSPERVLRMRHRNTRSSSGVRDVSLFILTFSQNARKWRLVERAVQRQKQVTEMGKWMDTNL